MFEYMLLDDKKYIIKELNKISRILLLSKDDMFDSLNVGYAVGKNQAAWVLIEDLIEELEDPATNDPEPEKEPDEEDNGDE